MTKNPSRKGTLELLVGPSGVGKTSSIDGTMKSYRITTRPKRKDETSKDGSFISEEDFLEKAVAGELIGVHRYPDPKTGNWYGFPKERIEKALESGENVSEQIVDCDAALQVAEHFGEERTNKTLSFTHYNELVLRLIRRDGFKQDLQQRVKELDSEIHKYAKNIDEFDNININPYDWKRFESDKEAMKEAYTDICLGIMKELFLVTEEESKDFDDHFRAKYFSGQDPLENMKRKGSFYTGHEAHNIWIESINNLLFRQGYKDYPNWSSLRKKCRKGDDSKEGSKYLRAEILGAYTHQHITHIYEEILETLPMKAALMFAAKRAVEGKEEYRLIIDVLEDTDIDEYEKQVIRTCANRRKEGIDNYRKNPIDTGDPLADYFAKEDIFGEHPDFEDAWIAFGISYANYLNLISDSNDAIDNDYITGNLKRDYSSYEDENDIENYRKAFFPLYIWNAQHQSDESSIYKILGDVPSYFTQGMHLSRFMRSVISGKCQLHNEIMDEIKDTPNSEKIEKDFKRIVREQMNAFDRDRYDELLQERGYVRL